MLTKYINLKNTIVLVLFLVGFSTISYSLFKLNQNKHNETSINVKLENKWNINL
jgi:hypothetical protein